MRLRCRITRKNVKLFILETVYPKIELNINVRLKGSKTMNLSEIEEKLIESIRANLKENELVKVRQFDKYGNILSIYIMGAK